MRIIKLFMEKKSHVSELLVLITQLSKEDKITSTERVKLKGISII